MTDMELEKILSGMNAAIDMYDTNRTGALELLQRTFDEAAEINRRDEAEFARRRREFQINMSKVSDYL